MGARRSKKRAGAGTQRIVHTLDGHEFIAGRLGDFAQGTLAFARRCDQRR